MLSPGLIIGAFFVTMFLALVFTGLLAMAANAYDEGSIFGTALFGGVAFAIAYFLVLSLLSCGG